MRQVDLSIDGGATFLNLRWVRDKEYSKTLPCSVFDWSGLIKVRCLMSYNSQTGGRGGGSSVSVGFVVT